LCVIIVYVYVYLVVFVVFFLFCSISSSTLILLLGLLTCKNRLPYNLYSVGGDVKHCSLTHSRRPMSSDIMRQGIQRCRPMSCAVWTPLYSALLHAWIIYN